MYILQEYMEKDPCVIVLQQQNAGAGVARNYGVNIAQGEYVHFLDADDYLVEDAYKNLYLQSNIRLILQKNPYCELFVLQKNNSNHFNHPRKLTISWILK